MEKQSTSQVLKKLVAFSIPLILSGLLQQLFNWVDALIVGNLIGETALGGIGATSSIYNLFVMLLVGFTSGLSVLFAQQFGRKQIQQNKRLLANYSVLLAVIFTIVSVIGIVFVIPIVELMDTPAALFDYAVDYLRIVLIGVPFLAIYNTYSALLRGMGNSTVPFIAVLISSVVNAVLDFVFVAFFYFGVAGAAAATTLSQIAMTVYIVIYTTIKHPELRFNPFQLCRYKGVVGVGGEYGMPPAVQNSVTSIGNLFLQKFMNGFGNHTVSAITTAYRVDSVLFLPIVNFSTAISTLVAQETGAGNDEAAKRIFKLGTIIMVALSAALTGVIMLLGYPLLSIFGLSGKSIEIGVEFFQTISLFYIVYALSMSVKGYLEGKSDMLFSGVIGICSLVVRIVCSYTLADLWGNKVVAYAEAFGWIFLLIAFAIRYVYKVCKE